MNFILAFFICLSGYLIFHLFRYCSNKYHLIFYVGKKGSGKTLGMSLAAARHVKKKKGYVYSNFGVGMPLAEDYYNYSYPAESLILIDEAGLVHNNRDFKSFPEEAREFFKFQRKNHLNIILSSQYPDIDLQVRQLIDSTYVFSRLGFLGFKRRYRNTIKVVTNPETGATRLADCEEKVGLFPKVYFITKAIRNAELFDTDSGVTFTAEGAPPPGEPPSGEY
ncbi:MAG: hypothetical protein DBY09_07250 [Selenomonadales bacterium]|jgi:hypothetical protein|nr:hypothetical protein [Clostridium sp.]PWL96557.1 MAG: hypothetical protein DBY09_07250 [Selenomonadales bacterium]DAJ36441.1 MAG TPA: zonular occludens toxin [Inoviridae sp.]